MCAAADSEARELDHRESDGIDVKLLWSARTDQVWVAVRDERAGTSFRLEVEPGDALTAFRHPYAYVAAEDADHAVAA